MPGFDEPIARLIEALKLLPGIGQKTATRLAFHILGRPAEEALALARSIEEARRRIRSCAVCGNFSEAETCAICSDPRRDAGAICVVEEAANLAAVERTGFYRGMYHVLGGALSPLRGIGPEELRIASLMQRIQTGAVREVILATSPNVEGSDGGLPGGAHPSGGRARDADRPGPSRRLGARVHRRHDARQGPRSTPGFLASTHLGDPRERACARSGLGRARTPPGPAGHPWTLTRLRGPKTGPSWTAGTAPRGALASRDTVNLLNPRWLAAT